MAKRKGYITFAKKLYPKAIWINGQGQYALLAYCGGLTVTLHETQESAVKSKETIDQTGCGSQCRNSHKIVDLSNCQR